MTTDEEDYIPPMELRNRERREREETSPISDNDSMLSDAYSMETVDYDWPDYMNVEALTNKKGVAQACQRKAKNFLNALANMF